MNKNAILLPLLLLCMFFAVLPPVVSAELYGRVVGISDGDTITVLAQSVPHKIRLSGIDCPEKSQAYGQVAKEFTAAHCFGKDVKVEYSAYDKYRRIIGEVILPDGQNLSDLLLENGYAWWYRRYSTDEQRHELEDNARRLRMGLWSDSEPLPPWDYRKARR